MGAHRQGDPECRELQQPYVRTTTEFDVSTEGPRVHELLEQRGPLYDEHLAACAAARDVLAPCDDIADHLAKRAGELNATDPQLQRPHDLLKPPKGDSDDHGGFAETVHWVPAHLVVSTNHPSWGDFDGHRDRAPFDIVEGLLSSDLEAFTHRLFTDEISLMRAPRYATHVNTIYEHCYPGALAQLGIPLAIGTDPAAWTQWLTAAAQ